MTYQTASATYSIAQAQASQYSTNSYQNQPSYTIGTAIPGATFTNSATNSISWPSAIGTGVSNAVLQTNTSGYAQWASVNGSWTQPTTSIKGGNLELTGEDADIVINGVRLSDTLNMIMERLNIVQTNSELEKDWEDLAELGRLYREKEAWVKERAKLVDLLSKD